MTDYKFASENSDTATRNPDTHDIAFMTMTPSSISYALFRLFANCRRAKINVHTFSERILRANLVRRTIDRAA